MSKATEALAAKLVPGSKTPRAAQYKIAWDLLLHLPDADEWHRAQAKCWLTYRAFDGEVPLADWQEKISLVVPKPTDWMKVRWDCSQTTAEAYLWIKWGKDQNVGIEAAERVYAMEPQLQEYPPTILNWLRIVTILAVRKWAIGCDGEAKDLITAAIARWRTVIAGFQWRHHPTRFREMMDDANVLCLLMFLAQRLGMTKRMLEREWNSAKSIAQKFAKEPWIICLAAVQTPERSLW